MSPFVVFRSLVLVTAIAMSVNATITTIGDVSPGGTAIQGAMQNSINGMNGSHIFGWYEGEDGETYGFIYDGTNYTTIDYPGEDWHTSVNDIDGSNIVGTYGADDPSDYGFIYDGTNYTTFLFPEALRSSINGIDGSNIFGWYEGEDGETYGFIYDGTNYTTIDYPGEDWHTSVNDIDGSNIVGTYGADDPSDYGFIYDGTDYTTFTLPAHWVIGNLDVGHGSGGTLNITDGDVVSSGRGLVGASGIVTVTGPSSQWNMSSYLTMGGALNIEEGGLVSSVQGVVQSGGVVTVTGPDSQWDNIGNLIIEISRNQTVTLNVHNGAASLHSGDIVIVGNGDDTKVVLNGDGTVLASGDLYLVGESSAVLNILNGIKVDTANAYIGHRHSDHLGHSDYLSGPWIVTVSGTDSVWAVSGDMVVGHANRDWEDSERPHKLTISDGAELQVGGSLHLLQIPPRLNSDGYYSEYYNQLHEIILDGGTLSVGSLSGRGKFIWESGTLEITGAAGLTLPPQDWDNLAGLGFFSPEDQQWMFPDSSSLFGYPWTTNLTISTDQTLKVSNTTTITTGAKVTVLGEFTSDLLQIESGGQFHIPSGFISHNEIRLNGDDARLTGGVLTNHSLLRGTGRIEATLDNHADGKVRVNHSQQMHFTGSAENNNAGLIHLVGTSSNPAVIEFDGALTNAGSTGRITARHAIVHFNEGVDNQGAIALGFGTSDIFGEVDNNGTVVVTGSGNATFYGDMANHGTLQISEGSTAVFFGSLSGNSIAGLGTTFIEGDLSPGSSPGTMSFGGDVVLGVASTTNIELGETSDQLLVDGNASIDGELNVELLGDFTPDHGDQFPVITAGTRDGEFDTIDGIQVAADLTLAPIYDYAGHIGLMLIAAAPGDANFDGIVDVADLGILGANFNAADMQWNTGDFNLDSTTDVADLGILGANWTASQSTGNASALVPEPTTLSLLAMSVLLVGRRRR